MRRLSLRNLPPAWKRVTILAAVFVTGALFDRYMMPWLARDVGVWELHGGKEQGCKGTWGATIIRLGRGMGQVDGTYDIPCGKISTVSDTAALFCKCD